MNTKHELLPSASAHGTHITQHSSHRFSCRRVRQMLVARRLNLWLLLWSLPDSVPNKDESHQQSHQNTALLLWYCILRKWPTDLPSMPPGKCIKAATHAAHKLLRYFLSLLEALFTTTLGGGLAKLLCFNNIQKQCYICYLDGFEPKNKQKHCYFCYFGWFQTKKRTNA